MTADEILSLGPALAEYLDEFADCFGRCEPRWHLSHYVQGQLSNLQRKSVEPIALFNNIAPRTLQEFLASDSWDHVHARDHVQRIVARDHRDSKAIGIIDDSGHPKSGKMTPGVQWQYCGRLGKIGMTPDEVRVILGDPVSYTMSQDMDGTWEYTEFQIRFRKGRVDRVLPMGKK
jgi:SRSO17 transposase